LHSLKTVTTHQSPEIKRSLFGSGTDPILLLIFLFLFFLLLGATSSKKPKAPPFQIRLGDHEIRQCCSWSKYTSIDWAAIYIMTWYFKDGGHGICLPLSSGPLAAR